MKVAAYIRVSTDKEEQKLSFEHQKTMLERYASDHNDELIEVYADEGKSGTKMQNRPGLLRMLEDAKRGKFQKIYAKDVSRICRNTFDFIQMGRDLEKVGVRFHLMDFGEAGQDMDPFTINILSMVAEQESRKMSQRLKAGKRVSMERGIVPNFVFGYERVDKFTLKPHPTQADWVKRIFDLYTVERWGQARIAQYLFENQVETSKKKNGVPNTNWSQTTVKKILSNPIYTGWIINHKETSRSIFTNEKILLPEEEWIKKYDESIRLISDEQFQLAQEICKENSKSFSNNAGGTRRSERHLFSNLIRCGECGFAYRRQFKNYPKKGLTVWWVCSKRSAYGKDRCPSQYTKVYESWLIPALSEMLSGFLENKSDFFKLVEVKCRKAIKDYLQSVSGCSIDALQMEFQELINKRGRIKEMAANGLITMDEAAKDMIPLNAEINRLQMKLGEVDTANEIAERVKDELRQFIKNFKSADLLTMSNADLKRIIREIRVISQEEVEVYLNLGKTIEGVCFPLKLKEPVEEEQSPIVETVHKDISERLPQFNRALYIQVKEVLDVNKAQRHIRGGIATRRKYRGT